MKKVILTIAVLVAGIVSVNAQNNTNTLQKSNESVVRITNSMSNDDIGLEFINNFYKIELSDLTPSNKAFTTKNKIKQSNEDKLNEKNGLMSGIILDIYFKFCNHFTSNNTRNRNIYRSCRLII
jgi:hypothetical protein